MDKTISVAVIDDHLVSRKGIISLLSENPRVTVVAEGMAGNHVLQLLDKYKPDVLITDLQMPANVNGNRAKFFEPVSTLQEAIRQYPQTAIMVLSQEYDVQRIQSLAEIGVKGYILKSDDFTGILGKAVEMIYFGAMYFSPEIQKIIYSAPRMRNNKSLTPQQLNILNTAVRFPELSREQLADSLYISKSTLQKHIAGIFEVLDVPNMESAIIKAMRMQLIDIETILGQ
jgi:DNA-binding NarL/FixJ family response regulator